MYTRSMLALLLTLTLATAASAKMKLSGEATCAKPDPQCTVEVGDRADHSFRLNKGKCTATKPFQIGGIASASEEFTEFVEITGDKSRAHGLDVVTMANGDKLYIPYQSTGTADGAEVRWTISGGTGKFTGVKGKGTSKVKVGADGTSTVVAEGTYTLPK